MANVCTQVLYIVASNEEDMRDLMLNMLSTFKKATQTDDAAEI